jgi:hypothetical protein
MGFIISGIPIVGLVVDGNGAVSAYRKREEQLLQIRPEILALMWLAT